MVANSGSVSKNDESKKSLLEFAKKHLSFVKIGCGNGGRLLSFFPKVKMLSKSFSSSSDILVMGKNIFPVKV